MFDLIEMLTAWPVRLIRDPAHSTSTRLLRTLANLLSKHDPDTHTVHCVASDTQRVLEVERVRTFVDEKDVSVPILECSCGEEKVHLQGNEVSKFTRIPILANPHFLVLEVDPA